MWEVSNSASLRCEKGRTYQFVCLALSHQVLLVSSVRSGINSCWACQVGHTHHCGLECMIPVDCVTLPIIWTLLITVMHDFAVHGEASRLASGNPFDANISNNDVAAS